MARCQAARDRRRHARGPPQEHRQGSHPRARSLSRLLVTRAQPEADLTAARLRAAGHEVAVVPCIVREPLSGLAEALAACPAPDVLLLTSAHAARRVAEAAPATFRPGKVAVVGPATAEGARAAGLTVHMEPDQPTGVAAVAALGDLRGLTVLYARAETSVAATTEALEASGAVVVHAVAYRTGPAPDLAAALDAAGPVDHALFFSPSAVHSYVDACDRTTFHHRVSALAIGPTTARACEAAGLTVLVTAAHADLVATLAGLTDRA